jgi:1-acyl-sn-glycerol-3-phosphate acyltransferase
MIRATLVLLVLLVSTPVLGSSILLAALLGFRDRPHSIFDWVPQAWARMHLFAAGVRVVEHGTEHKAAAQHVFVANHLGNFDVFALLSKLRWVKFVAKAELFRVPLMGPAMLKLGMIPIERANRKAAFSSFAVATQRIAAGASVTVYPEGTRGTAYPLRPFKKGPFVLAIQAQAPIIPVLIHGALDVQRKGEFKVRPGTINMHYLPAIPTQGMTYDQRDELARLTYEAMAACLLREYGVASPPYRATAA